MKLKVYTNVLNNLITINNDPETGLWMRDQITIA
jgi:hypothetical protein